MTLPEKHPDVAHVSDNADNDLDVIQRSNLMDNFVIWTPERDGHEPPFWQDGMVCQYWQPGSISPWRFTKMPLWGKNDIYRVPAEAVNGPHFEVDDFEAACGLIVQDWHSASPNKKSMADIIRHRLSAYLLKSQQPREVSNG